MNRIKLLAFLCVFFSLFFISAKDEGEGPRNRFDVALEYSQTSGFIPAVDILWHYNETFFSSLYGNYFISAEKKTLRNYENSKYAVFSKNFVLGSDVLGFYFLKNPVLFALSFGLEYQRVKNEEFGFFDDNASGKTVTFEDRIYQHLLLPFIKFTSDKRSKIINNRFLLVFYPSYGLFLEQNICFKMLVSSEHTANSSKWQVPAFEISDEVFFNFHSFGGILLNAAFSFRQAEYTTAVPQKTYDGFGEAEVRQRFLEYGVTMSYVIPLEIAGTIRPKAGVGLSGSAEFRKNGGKNSTNRDIGYLFVFGFHY